MLRRGLSATATAWKSCRMLTLLHARPQQRGTRMLCYRANRMLQGGHLAATKPLGPAGTSVARRGTAHHRPIASLSEPPSVTLLPPRVACASSLSCVLGTSGPPLLFSVLLSGASLDCRDTITFQLSFLPTPLCHGPNLSSPSPSPSSYTVSLSLFLPHFPLC